MTDEGAGGTGLRPLTRSASTAASATIVACPASPPRPTPSKERRMNRLPLALLLLLVAQTTALAVTSADFARGSSEYGGVRLPYRLYTPPGLDGGARYPLIVFMHGIGECGVDNELQLKDECK